MTREIDDATEAVRAKVDPETFAAAWEQGSKMSLDEAVALALGETDPDA